jgi:acyl-CoA hydrolase/GNAT superfamily N-acetyltransferase
MNTSAREAVRLIPPGKRILIGSGAAEPVSLVEALVADADQLVDNDVVHLLTLGPAPYVRPEHAHRFRHTAFFIGANVRDAVAEGRADFLPVFLSEIPELIRSRRVRVDVALIQVSPPDRHGYVSLGVSVDIVRAAVESAELVLAEVNPRMPRTHGQSFVHVSRLDRMIEVDRPLLEHTADPPGDVERAIGGHIASLIPDGATLQTGIGKIPDAVLAALGSHEELGVHTEMLSDGVMRLAESGVITGAKKSLHAGKMVTSFVMGSRALYEWVHDHPGIEMRPSDYTNDPSVIARHDRMIAINAALAVDLTGQVASDTVRGKFFSGIGGQVDFIRGAARSRGGRAIIALPSTAQKGTVSRIQPAFEEGAGIVTSRGDVHYVVTEYGVADLWGRSIRERALALIEIAHPKFRAELTAAAVARKYVFQDRPVVARASTSAPEPTRLVLPDGTKLAIRAVHLADEEAVKRLLYDLSDEAAYQRFLSFRKDSRHRELREIVDVDYARDVALCACPDDGDPCGVVRYEVDPATGLGDLAFIVAQPWRGRGVATALMSRLAEVAKARGLAGFSADVLAGNTAMLGVLQRSGLTIESKLSDGVYHVVAKFTASRAGASGPATRA